MPFTTRLKLFHSCYLSKPATDRILYRAIHRQRIRRILELGIGPGQRALRMIQVAGLESPLSEVRFTGLDWFEARSETDGPGLTLKAAYSLLRGSGARVQLLPGDPIDTLAQRANALGQVDLLIFSAGLDPMRLGRTWLLVPQLLHEHSQVYVEKPVFGGGMSLEIMPASEIRALAASATRLRAA